MVDEEGFAAKGKKSPKLSLRACEKRLNYYGRAWPAADKLQVGTFVTFAPGE